MGQRISSSLSRHRGKLFVVGGVVGGFVILNSYMRRRFRQWEKQQTLEYIDQVKRQSHFDGTLQTCDTAVMSFVQKIRERICETLDLKPIVEELKKKPPNKVELWEELKVMVFSQMVTEIYAHCLLVVLLRVQISVLGGYIFSDYQNNGNQSSSGTENHQKYLSHISNFFVSGIISLTFPVEESVRKAFKDISLSDQLRLSDFHNIFRNIFENMSRGEKQPIPDVSRYFMLTDFSDSSMNNDNAEYDHFMQKIVTETKDILECDDFKNILSCCLVHGMATLMDRMSECYMHLSCGEEADFINPHNVAVPLAKVIPTIHSVFENHQPNEPGSLVHNLLQQDSLKSFAANLYEAFSQESV